MQFRTIPRVGRLIFQAPLLMMLCRLTRAEWCFIKNRLSQHAYPSSGQMLIQIKKSFWRMLHLILPMFYLVTNKTRWSGFCQRTKACWKNFATSPTRLGSSPAKEASWGRKLKLTPLLILLQHCQCDYEIFLLPKYTWKGNLLRKLL